MLSGVRFGAKSGHQTEPQQSTMSQSRTYPPVESVAQVALKDVARYFGLHASEDKEGSHGAGHRDHICSHSWSRSSAELSGDRGRGGSVFLSATEGGGLLTTNRSPS